MLRKIASKWWVILLSVAVCLAAAANSNYRQKQLYTARTTLLAAAAKGRVSIDTLAGIARSGRVLEVAATALGDHLGNDSAPRVLSRTSIERVKDTDILAVDVTLPDPGEAKEAAGIVAASIKKAFQEMPALKDEPALETVDPMIVVPVNQSRTHRLVEALIAGMIAGIVIAAVLPGGSGRNEKSVAGRMGERIARRWWLMVLGAMAGLFITGFLNYSTVPMCIGRTTLMPPPASAKQRQQEREVIGSLSNTIVAERAAQVLGSLGLTLTAREVLRATSVHVISDTDLFAVEVTLRDADEAKVVADVMAAEMKKAYAKLYPLPLVDGAGSPHASGPRRLVTVDPAVAFPVDQHRVRKLWIGLIGGVLLGAILAAMIPISREGV